MAKIRTTPEEFQVDEFYSGDEFILPLKKPSEGLKIINELKEHFLVTPCRTLYGTYLVMMIKVQ